MTLKDELNSLRLQKHFDEASVRRAAEIVCGQCPPVLPSQDVVLPDGTSGWSRAAVDNWLSKAPSYAAHGGAFEPNP